MSDKLTYDLVVGKDDLSKSLKNASKEALNLENVLTTAVGVFAGNIVTKGFDLLVGAIGSVTDQLSQSIDAAAASEVAINNLNAALGRAGNNTKQARENLAAFANELQRTTTFEDDAAYSSLALLQSLTKLNADGLQKGVSAAADLATVLGIDLESATRLVAKGAEGNVEAFKRYGVEIQKGSTDTETFANLLEKLTSQFGGAATSQLNTYTGSVQALKNNFGDLQESFGGIVTNNTTLIAFFNVLSDAAAEASGNIANTQQPFNEVTKVFVNLGVAATEATFQILDFITFAIEPLVEVILGVGTKILTFMVLPIEKLIDGMIALGKITPGLSDTFKDLENPISGASEALNDLSDGILGSITTFDGNAFGSASKSIENFGNAIIDAEAKVASGKLIAEQANKDRLKNEEESDAAILANRKQLSNDILVLQQQLANEEKAFQDQLAITGQEENLAKRQAEIQAIFDQKIAEADAVLQGELLKNQAIKDAQQRALADQKTYENFSLQATKITNERILADKKAMVENEKRINKDREANQKDTISTIATLSQSGNKTLAAIGKAAALTQIAIDTPVAIGKALSAFPPPFNFAAASAVGAAMAAQAARVAGVQFENGGVVGQGASVGPDNRVATIRDGELILNANQQKKLFDAINSGSFGGGEIVVQIDGREIARAVRDQINNGFRLA